MQDDDTVQSRKATYPPRLSHNIKQACPTLALQMFLDFNSQKSWPAEVMLKASGSCSLRTSGGPRLDKPGIVPFPLSPFPVMITALSPCFFSCFLTSWEKEEIPMFHNTHPGVMYTYTYNPYENLLHFAYRLAF